MTHKNHIEQLIHELCPNGVNYMPLGEIERKGLISLGRGNVISKKDIAKTPGNYPIYSSSGQGNGEMGRYGLYMFSDKRITWSIDGGGKFFFRDDLFYSVTNVCGWLKVNKADLLNIKYLYYVLYEQWTHKVFDYTVKAHPSVIRDSYKIPLPPLPIQEVIVRILDAFANLIENINTEIKERERQLDCALNALFDCNIPTKTLGEIGGFYRGNGLQKKDFVERGIGCIHYGQIYTKFSTSAKETLTYVPEQLAKKLLKVHTGNLIIACTGENIEDLCKSVVWMGKEDIVIGGHSVVFRHTQDPLYIAYYFQSPLFAKQKVKYIIGAKVSDIKAENIAKINIPLPPLAEQRAIAEKLDTIEAFVNNLKTERDLRQQQYEYYREYLINLLK